MFGGDHRGRLHCLVDVNKIIFTGVPCYRVFRKCSTLWYSLWPAKECTVCCVVLCWVVLCCLMRLHEWGYEGEFLRCHGMSWRVQDFSVVKLPCPGIRGKGIPVCQSVRRPWDLGHALRSALCESPEAHIHCNIATDLNSLSWIAVFTLHFTDFPGVCAQPVPSL